ncbi:MAG: fluoride efflux transporter CrcB [Labilithrix sp.]|nr:fluoride efflux transporter CrcB [Labilithrix sp.]
MERFLWIGLCGALGTWVRYLVAQATARLFGTAFPYGTLIVNLVGCFLMAAVMHVALTTTRISETMRFALATGFLGGLTTYSAFNFETTKLASDGFSARAALYFGLTVVGCLVAGFAGLVVARRIVGA